MKMNNTYMVHPIVRDAWMGGGGGGGGEQSESRQSNSKCIGTQMNGC